MTEATKVLSIRLESKEKEELAKYLNRDSAEGILKQIRSGEIKLSRKGVEFMRVNTEAVGVDTTSERLSENAVLVTGVNSGVNTDCDRCPYLEEFNLNMNGFNEVCEYKGLDKQKALDKCVQMLWR